MSQVAQSLAPAVQSGAARYVLIAGRLLLAALFILAGALKIIGPAPFLAHMAEHRVPAFLLIGVIALELGAGICVLIGWKLPFTAGALAAFCVATALIFHSNFADKAERTLFVKDLAIAGGLLVLASTAIV